MKRRTVEKLRELHMLAGELRGYQEDFDRRRVELITELRKERALDPPAIDSLLSCEPDDPTPKNLEVSLLTTKSE